MNYPDEFKAEVRALYPDWSQLHQKIEEGSTVVGLYLGDSISPYVSQQDVLKATSLEALKDKAANVLVKATLYDQWCRMYEETVKHE